MEERVKRSYKSRLSGNQLAYDVQEISIDGEAPSLALFLCYFVIARSVSIKCLQALAPFGTEEDFSGFGRGGGRV